MDDVTVGITPETLLLWLALFAYGAALAVPLRQTVGAIEAQDVARCERWTGFFLATGLLLHTASLGTRWNALGHGPFTTMHEILSSNLWSLTLVFAVAWWAVREVRANVVAVTPVLGALALWMLMANPAPGHFPATYSTPLLYLHALVGKVYLGLLLVAVALGAAPWLRRLRRGARQGASEGALLAWVDGARGASASGAPHGSVSPDAARLDELAHRFAAFALVADTLMLIVGAVWAQDAWGRYWAWDPLESWAFVSWLALVAALHARATLRPSPALHGVWLAGVFVLAFLTFFGVPFLSVAPHKGAV